MSADTSSRGGGIHDSTAVEISARAGLVIYGVLHLVFAYVAVRLVLTDASGQATGTGALALLAQDATGRVVLGAMAIGMVLLVVWQLITAAVGYPDDGGTRRHVMRLAALARAGVYGYFAGASARLALEGRSASSGSPDSMSARLMSAPGGTAILTAIGLVVAGVGVGLAVYGLTSKFLDQLDEDARNKQRRVSIVLVGQVGYVAKGVAFLVVGGLLAWAALSRDPKKAGGLDSALQELLGGAYGGPALVVIAVGVAWFGVYTLIRSRHMANEIVTSQP